eukprot:294794_1
MTQTSTDNFDYSGDNISITNDNEKITKNDYGWETAYGKLIVKPKPNMKHLWIMRIVNCYAEGIAIGLVESAQKTTNDRIYITSNKSNPNYSYFAITNNGNKYTSDESNANTFNLQFEPGDIVMMLLDNNSLYFTKINWNDYDIDYVNKINIKLSSNTWHLHAKNIPINRKYKLAISLHDENDSVQMSYKSWNIKQECKNDITDLKQEQTIINLKNELAQYKKENKLLKEQIHQIGKKLPKEVNNMDKFKIHPLINKNSKVCVLCGKGLSSGGCYFARSANPEKIKTANLKHMYQQRFNSLIQ